MRCKGPTPEDECKSHAVTYQLEEQYAIYKACTSMQLLLMLLIHDRRTAGRGIIIIYKAQVENSPCHNCGRYHTAI